MMKTALITIIGALFAFSVYAADEEHSNSATVDQSKNPLTGTKTTTKKWKTKVKDAHGKAEKTTTETTKEMTDGSKSKETKTSTESKSE